MKLFQFAVASIVDANTGYGLPHNSGGPDYRGEISYGRDIRAKSILALLQKAGRGISASIARFKARLQQQQDLRQIRHLNDHLLQDIGVTREDLHAVSDGIIGLDELSLRRQTINRPEFRQKAETVRVDRTTVAANQDHYGEVRCA